jgi:hypothetical protein
MNSLASGLWSQGRLTEAEELEARVVKTRMRLLESEHRSTLTSWAGLAYTLKSQGRDEDAVDLMKQVARLLEETLGFDHSETIYTAHCQRVAGCGRGNSRHSGTQRFRRCFAVNGLTVRFGAILGKLALAAICRTSALSALPSTPLRAGFPAIIEAS